MKSTLNFGAILAVLVFAACRPTPQATSGPIPLPALTGDERACLVEAIGARALAAIERGARGPSSAENDALERCIEGFLRFAVRADGAPGPGIPILLEPAPHPPIPADPDCEPLVYMWFDAPAHALTYFTDEPYTYHYSVDCATGVSVEHTTWRWSAAEALDAHLAGEIGDAGRSGTYYEDAAAAGVLTGGGGFDPAVDPAAGFPAQIGYHSWTISAGNALNPAASPYEETLRWAVVTRPATAPSCAAWVECIEAMVRHIVPLVGPGITGNAALDDAVDAFRDGILDRREIGLRLERELERSATLTTFECEECVWSHYSESTPDVVYLDWCEDEEGVLWYPSDYALLHELTHKVGFDTRLITAYIDAGLWPAAASDSAEWAEYRSRVEDMTGAVSGAAFDRSRACIEY